jgi:ribosome-associated protein
VKAHDIRVYDTEALSPLFERVLIASGTSNRQTRAIAASVVDAVQKAGFPKPRLEDTPGGSRGKLKGSGEWIIVDCGAAVAHVMQPEIRRYYNLEEIWGETPVPLATAAERKAAAKAKKDTKSAGGAGDDAPKAKATRKPAAKKTASAADADVSPAAKAPAKKASGKTTAAKTTAKPAAKAPAKKAPARKAPARKPAAQAEAPVQTQVVGAAKPAARKPAAKKPAAKKTSATKAPAKPAAKKPAAKKA